MSDDKELDAEWRIAAKDFEISLKTVGLARSLELVAALEPMLRMSPSGRMYLAYAQEYGQRECLRRRQEKD